MATTGGAERVLWQLMSAPGERREEQLGWYASERDRERERGLLHLVSFAIYTLRTDQWTQSSPACSSCLPQVS